MDPANQTSDLNKIEIVAGSQSGVSYQAGVASRTGLGSQVGVGSQSGVGSNSCVSSQTGVGCQTGVSSQTGVGCQTGVGSQTDVDKRSRSRTTSEANNEGFSKRKIYPRLSKSIYPRLSGLIHTNPRCMDRQISRQKTLDGESWDTCAWLEQVQIFKMLERRSSHADPELSCIITFWRRRFRGFKTKLFELPKPEKYIDIDRVKHWAEELKKGLENKPDLNVDETQQLKKQEIMIDFLDSFTIADIMSQNWTTDAMTTIQSCPPSEVTLRLVSKQNFNSAFHRYVERNGSNKDDLKDVLIQFAYAEEFRWWPPKPFCFFLLIFHLSFFLYNYFSSPLDTHSHLPNCSSLILNPHRPYEFWRYVTYSFVHFNSDHLTSNLLGIIIASVFLEYTNKWWRIAPVYLAGVAISGLLLTAIHPKPLVGMSAGVYAVMAASIPDLVLNWTDIKILLRQQFGNKKKTVAISTCLTPKTFPTWLKIKHIRLAIPLTWMSFDLGYSIYIMETRCSKPGVVCGTSYYAHIIGMITGIVTGFLWLKNRRFKKWVVVLQRFLRYMIAILIFGLLIKLVADLAYQCQGKTKYSCDSKVEEDFCCIDHIDKCCLHYIQNVHKLNKTEGT